MSWIIFLIFFINWAVKRKPYSKIIDFNFQNQSSFYKINRLKNLNNINKSEEGGEYKFGLILFWLLRPFRAFIV